MRPLYVLIVTILLQPIMCCAVGLALAVNTEDIETRHTYWHCLEHIPLTDVGTDRDCYATLFRIYACKGIVKVVHHSWKDESLAQLTISHRHFKWYLKCNMAEILKTLSIGLLKRISVTGMLVYMWVLSNNGHKGIMAIDATLIKTNLRWTRLNIYSIFFCNVRKRQSCSESLIWFWLSAQICRVRCSCHVSGGYVYTQKYPHRLLHRGPWL